MTLLVALPLLPFLAIITVLCLPTLVDLGAIVTIAWRGRRTSAGRAADSPLPRLLFLVPAHDEALLIGNCVRSLLAQEYATDRRKVVVIADNCTDETAELARAAGASSLVRIDAEKRGKPHALAWALDQLAGEDYNACVVIDADTVVQPSFSRHLAAHSPLDSKAVQAYFGIVNERDNWLTRLSGVLVRCRYEVTYPLRHAAGLNCALTGNGMCIGRSLLTDGWQAFSLTENWELFSRYTAEGISIDYARDAILYSQEAKSLRQANTQRTRWLAGRMWVFRRWAWPLLGSSRIGVFQRLAALSELCAPSPVLHAVMAPVIASLALLVLPRGLSAAIAMAAILSLASPVATTAVVLVRQRERAATLAAFLHLPGYAIWRVAVALRTLAFSGKIDWRKTERHDA